MKRLDVVKVDIDALHAACSRKHWTRAELAARARLSIRTLWRIGKGEPVGLAAARRLARALGVSVAALISDRSESASEGQAAATATKQAFGVDDGGNH